MTVLIINSKPGVLRQIRAADREMAGEFEMVLRGRSQTKIKVEAEDIHPPVLTVTAGQGFEDETRHDHPCGHRPGRDERGAQLPPV